jgi:hypothetical protein
MTTDMINKGLSHTIAGAAEVTVIRDHAYASGQGPLGFDLYRPPHASAPCPAVVFVTGFPDPGAAAFFGKPLKDWASYMDWARLVAASGIAAILYLNREPGDVVALVRHLRANAGALGIDAERLGVWACSGNVPNALGLVARERVRCAAFLYGYMLDLDGASEVAEAAAQFHFAAPPTSFDDLPRDLPMLVVRAGRDETPGLDASIQRFVTAARARRMPLTVLEHPEAPHAFDLVDDSAETHRVIDEVLAFLQRALG